MRCSGRQARCKRLTGSIVDNESGDLYINNAREHKSAVFSSSKGSGACGRSLATLWFTQQLPNANKSTHRL